MGKVFKTLLAVQGLIGVAQRHGILSADLEAVDVSQPVGVWLAFLSEAAQVVEEAGVSLTDVLGVLRLIVR